MRRNTWSYLILILAAGAGLGASPLVEHEILLLDDDGTPLKGIPIEASTVTGWVPGMGFGRDLVQRQVATTDSNGLAVVRLPKGDGTIDYAIKRSNSVYW